MKTLHILWKRFWAESPAILQRVKKIVVTISAALIAASGAALAIISQYDYKVEWKEFMIGVLVFASFVSAFLTGLNLSTSNPTIQKLSDPETGLPKE